MPNSLQGLHVVVTRPAQQAAAFCQQLQQAGATVIAFPVIAITPVSDSRAAQAVLAQLDSYDAVIFISANAVEHGLALLSAAQRACLQHLTLGAIGKQTAQALQQHGYAVPWLPASGFTSEDFLALPQTQAVAGKRILIVRGVGGRELLAETLRTRGAQVDYVDVYQRSRPAHDPAELKQRHARAELDIIAITSSEGLENLLAMLDYPAWLYNVPLLVGSQRLLASARQAGFTGTIVIADNPSDAAMMQALHHWAKEFQV